MNIKIEISEELEIFTALCLLTDNKKVHSFFNEYVFYYIGNLKNNLSFLMESEIVQYLKDYKGETLLELMDEPLVKYELKKIKQQKKMA